MHFAGAKLHMAPRGAPAHPGATGPSAIGRWRAARRGHDPARGHGRAPRALWGLSEGAHARYQAAAVLLVQAQRRLAVALTQGQARRAAPHRLAVARPARLHAALVRRAAEVWLHAGVGHSPLGEGVAGDDVLDLGVLALAILDRCALPRPGAATTALGISSADPAMTGVTRPCAGIIPYRVLPIVPGTCGPQNSRPPHENEGRQPRG